MITSGVVLCAALLATSVNAYAAAAGGVGIGFGAITMVLDAKKPDLMEKKLFALPKLGDVSLKMLLGFFLFAWWAVAAGILTFQGPFLTTSNGYFGSWGSLAAAGMYYAETMPKPPESATGAAKDKGPVGGLLISSVVVLCADIQGNGVLLRLSWEPIIALVASIIGILWAILILAAEAKLPPMVKKVGSFCVLGLCVFEAFICTFRWPFLVTGNGYFGSWLMAICSLGASIPFLPDGLKNMIMKASDTKKIQPAGASASA